MPVSDVRSSMCLPLISLRFPLKRLVRFALFRSVRAPGRSRAYSERSRFAVSAMNISRPQLLHSPSGRRSRSERRTESERRKKERSGELNDSVSITSGPRTAESVERVSAEAVRAGRTLSAAAAPSFNLCVRISIPFS